MDITIRSSAIQTVHDTTPVGRIISAARASGLAAYDATYLQLAKQEQLPIATLDRGLAQAAKRGRSGVSSIAFTVDIQSSSSNPPELADGVAILVKSP